MQMNVYAGTQNSLMFPVMCDAYVNIDYSKNIANERTGIWDLTGSFTVEMIVTPYDVNGNGDNCNKASSVASVNNARGRQDSLKTMPATADNLATAVDTQDKVYLPTSARHLQQMVLFYNENIEISLRNKTTSQQNQPAEYCVLVKLTIDGTTQELETPVIVKSRDRHYNTYAAYNTYVYDNKGAAFAKESGYTVGAVSGKSLGLNGGTAANTFGVGQELFDSDGVSLGVVTAASGTILTMSKNLGSAGTVIGIGEKVYVAVNKEAIYLNSTYHIAFSFDNASKVMAVFSNGIKIGNAVHPSTGDFVFGTSDIYLGQNPDASTAPLRRNSQFMGEYHELAVTEGAKTKFGSFYTLTPQFRETLLYLDFEEVDE